MTPEIHLHVLASGSKGNAAVVEGPEGMVLVDCGISRRALMGRADELGLDMSRVTAVVLTHEHSDHVAGLTVFCNRFEGELVATAGTVGARSYLVGLPFTIVGHSDEIELAGMRVRTFPTSHDVADPMGLRFSTADDALGYCTDTGELGPEALDALSDVRVLALESNHDERMLATGPYLPQGPRCRTDRAPLQRAGGRGAGRARGARHGDRGRHAPLPGEQPSKRGRARACGGSGRGGDHRRGRPARGPHARRPPHGLLRRAGLAAHRVVAASSRADGGAEAARRAPRAARGPAGRHAPGGEQSPHTKKGRSPKAPAPLEGTIRSRD